MDTGIPNPFHIIARTKIHATCLYFKLKSFEDTKNLLENCDAQNFYVTATSVTEKH